MKRMWMFPIVLLFCTVPVSAADLLQLVESERNFSRLAGEKGIRTAFLEYLSEDSVVFHNGPVNGRKWYEGRPDSTGLLYWLPAVAELSVSGDLGYTSGPWEYRKASRDEAPVAYGTFVSIWKKQPDGRLKVAVDLGCGYPAASIPVSSLQGAVIQAAPAGKTAATMNVDREREALTQVDRKFSALSEAKGVAEAYEVWAVPAARLVRDGMEPLAGREMTEPMLRKVQGKLTWEPAEASVASSGDLGYTYGESSLTGQTGVEKGDYLRIWKRQPDGTWKAVLDVISKRQ